MLTDMQFVNIWQTSNSPAEVIKRTQLSKKAVYKRVTRYRNKGIPLKYFRLRGDVTKLIEQAEKLERVN